MIYPDKMVTARKPRYEAVLFDRELHEGFVKASWCTGAREAWEVLAAKLPG